VIKEHCLLDYIELGLPPYLWVCSFNENLYSITRFGLVLPLLVATTLLIICL